MSKRKTCNNTVTIFDTFNVNEVEQLIKKCNYTPYYDNPHTDDLIQFAAYTSTHKLIGFISCVTPEFLYNESDRQNFSKTVEIEITAMVDPEFRNQNVFSLLLNELKLYISSYCKHINIPSQRIKYIAANKKCQEENISSTSFKYSHSEYLMTLTPSDTNLNGLILKDINKNISNKIYIINNHDDIYKLINTRNGTVITSISYSVYDNSICIHDVLTMPYYRRTGCASYLLSVMIRELSKQNNNKKNDKENNIEFSMENNSQNNGNNNDYNNGNDNVKNNSNDNNKNNDNKNVNNHYNMTKSFILHVSGRNIAAINLYKRLGFEITDEIKYYIVV